MDDLEALKGLLYWALGSGSGWLVKRFMDWLITELKDDGKDPSPKTRRRLTYLASIAIPSALYGVYVLFGFDAYSPASHIMAVLTAFGVSQLVHGEQDLPGGREKVLRQYGLED